jgi:hypothetical protein
MGKRQPKRRPRGKAKPIPVEAQRLARDIERLRRLESYQKNQRLSAEKNREVIRWAKTSIDERAGKVVRNVETLDDLSRAIRTLDEPKAERVIRAYWSIWNVQGLKWGERALEMSQLGFNEFKEMSPTSFKTLCTRRLGLQYRPKKR